MSMRLRLLKRLAAMASLILVVAVLFLGVTAAVGLSPPAGIITALVVGIVAMTGVVITARKTIRSATADARGAPSQSIESSTSSGGVNTDSTFAVMGQEAYSPVVPTRFGSGFAAAAA